MNQKRTSRVSLSIKSMIALAFFGLSGFWPVFGDQSHKIRLDTSEGKVTGNIVQVNSLGHLEVTKVGFHKSPHRGSGPSFKGENENYCLRYEDHRRLLFWRKYVPTDLSNFGFNRVKGLDQGAQGYLYKVFLFNKCVF